MFLPSSRRRILLAGVASIALTATGILPANGGGAGGGAGSGFPSTIPASLMAHGAAAAAPVVPSWPGFAKGHLGANQRIVGTVVGSGETFEVQRDQERYYADGSVQAARHVFTLPVNLASGVLRTLTFSVANGAPNKAGFVTASALAAEKDFKFRFYGVDCGSTVYEVGIRDVVQNFPRDAWGVNPLGGYEVPVNGPVEVTVRGFAYLRDVATGQRHKWACLWIYVSKFANGQYEVSARLEQPRWNNTGGGTLGPSTSARLACYAELYEGSSRLYAWGGPNDPRTTTLPASTLFKPGSNLIAFGIPVQMQPHMPVVFSAATGGTLPSGIAAGTVYILRNQSTGFSLHLSRLEAEYNKNAVAFGSAGRGNVTVTPVTVAWYASCAILAGTDALPIRVGGTRVDVTIAWDEVYTSKWARMFPCYWPEASSPRISWRSFDANARYGKFPYWPNQPIPFEPGNYALNMNYAGNAVSDSRIGILDPNATQWYLKPHDPDYGQIVRQRAAMWAEQPFWLRDPASGRLVAGDNGPDNNGATTHAGLGPNRPTWGTIQRSGGCLFPDGAGSEVAANHAGYYEDSLPLPGPMRSSHRGAHWVMAAHRTGCLLFADQAPMQANAQIICDTVRNAVEPSDRNNLLGLGEQARGTGWCYNVVGFAEVFTGSDTPEGKYIKHALDNTDSWLNRSYVDDPTYAAPRAIGMIFFEQALGANNTYTHFAQAIGLAGTAMVARRGDRPGFKKLAEASLNFLAHAFNDRSPTGGSPHFAPVYAGYCKQNDGAGAFFPDVRAIIAGNRSYGYNRPPYPLGLAESGYKNGLGGFPGETTSGTTQLLVGLALAADCGAAARDHRESTAILVYDLIRARMEAAPNTVVGGNTFSRPAINQWWPKNAVVPASKMR